MRRTIVPALALLSVFIGACAPDGVTDTTGNSAGELPVNPSASRPPGGGLVVANLETPTGSRFQFIELTAANSSGVLIVEEGDEGTLVADRIFDAAGRDLSAAELYASLIDPADPEARVPQRLLDLSGPAGTSGKVGWALDLIRQEAGLTAFSTALASSSATIACDNASFTASIGYGFLAYTKKRLDTGPKIHPSIWPSYTEEIGPWTDSSYTLYWYRTVGWATKARLWRGKVCGKAGGRPAPTSFYQQNTWLRFLYRYGGQWWNAGGPNYALPFFEDEGAKVVAWYYDGGIGPIDWEIEIFDAASADQFDVLMTFNK
jgi:hypothetical protein